MHFTFNYDNKSSTPWIQLNLYSPILKSTFVDIKFTYHPLEYSKLWNSIILSMIKRYGITTIVHSRTFCYTRKEMSYSLVSIISFSPTGQLFSLYAPWTQAFFFLSMCICTLHISVSQLIQFLKFQFSYYFWQAYVIS